MDISAKYSVQIIKIYEDNGSSCPMPPSGLKESHVLPFQMTLEDEVVIHCINELAHLFEKPKSWNIFWQSLNLVYQKLFLF